MKKYKLKKDLPLAKAGDKVYVMKNKSKNSEIYKIYKYLQEYQDNRTGKVLGSIDLKDFGEWFEEIDQEKDIWNLNIGDFYYYISQCKVEKITILDDLLYIFYSEDLEFGNVFKTEEEAQKELNKRKAVQKIKKYCWENSIELANKKIITNSNITKYYLEYDLNDKKFDIIRTNYQYAGYHFTFQSYEDAEKILEKFEEELKIILNV